MKDGTAPPGLLPRQGSHEDVFIALRKQYPDENIGYRSSVGFALILAEDGSIQVTWKSTSMNGKFGYEGKVPQYLRTPIIEAVAKATGRRVWSL
jgi:hypothetical protein